MVLPDNCQIHPIIAYYLKLVHILGTTNITFSVLHVATCWHFVLSENNFKTFFFKWKLYLRLIHINDNMSIYRNWRMLTFFLSMLVKLEVISTIWQIFLYIFLKRMQCWHVFSVKVSSETAGNLTDFFFLFRQFGETPKLCCSEGQLEDLNANFKLAENFLGRCPTCFYNFRMNFCDMTCRPDQSRFLEPKYTTGPYEPCSQDNSGKKKYTPGMHKKFKSLKTTLHCKYKMDKLQITNIFRWL